MSPQLRVLLLSTPMVVTPTACGTDANFGASDGDAAAPVASSSVNPNTTESTHTNPGASPILEPTVPSTPPSAASALGTTPQLGPTTRPAGSTSAPTTPTPAPSSPSGTVTFDGDSDTAFDTSGSDTTAHAADRSDATLGQTSATWSGDDATSSSTASTGERSGCPHTGRIEYHLNGATSWPAEVTQLLTAAMDEALYYYNCYSDLSHQLTVNYDGSVPTAQANVDGWITFGSNRSYMVVATAMHEVAHTLGVGYYPWNELLREGRWTGSAVNQLMASIPADERDPDYGLRDYITADAQHFWPYGLNYASEHSSEWSLINHVRIVAAMRHDKEGYLSSR